MSRRPRTQRSRIVHQMYNFLVATSAKYIRGKITCVPKTIHVFIEGIRIARRGESLCKERFQDRKSGYSSSMRCAGRASSSFPFVTMFRCSVDQ